MDSIKKIRIGILGTGFGKTHGAIFKTFPDVELAGIVGRDEKKTMEIAQSLGIQGFTDPSLLIHNPEIDVIDICYPTDLHTRYAIAALNQGKHVFCETPAAYTMTEASHMARTADRVNKKMLVALFHRFVSDYTYIHDYIEGGYLGNIKAVFANRRTPPQWGEGWNENFIMDLMLHDIDYIIWLLGIPQSVTGRGQRNPGGGWNHVTLFLEYGKTDVVIEGCGIMPGSFPFSTSLRVVGEKGAIDLNWHWAGKAPESEVLLFPEQGKPEILSIPDYDPYEAECRYFIDVLRGKRDSRMLSIKTACDSLGIAAAAMESLEQYGNRIEL